MLLSHTYNLTAHVLIEQESRATQVGTLEGRLHGTELALARAREELARYRSAQGDLNQSLDQVGVVHVNKTYSVNKILFTAPLTGRAWMRRLSSSKQKPARACSP